MGKNRTRLLHVGMCCLLLLGTLTGCSYTEKQSVPEDSNATGSSNQSQEETNTNDGSQPVQGDSNMTEDKYSSMKMLQASGKQLLTSDGEPIILKGINAGGYLFQELWMTPTRESENVRAEQDIYITLENRFGTDAMQELLDVYMDAYWTEEDFKNCSDIGMNCIRLPFWYRNLVDENGNFYGYDGEAEDSYGKAFERIDWFIETAGKYGLYVILDFHGAPGSQSGSDHSGVDGRDNKQGASGFFFGEHTAQNQELFYSIWEVIADRYRDNPVVAGYDLLNEAYSSYKNNVSASMSVELNEALWEVYDTAYERIRRIDTNHVIIMEAVWTVNDLPNPAVYDWTNVMYEYHHYWNDDLRNEQGQQVSTLQSFIDSINEKNYDVPSYFGEFCLRDNMEAWDSGMELITQSGFHWTTWTYRVMSSYGNWGIYNNVWNEKEVDVEYDSFESIKEAWEKAGKDMPNTKLIAILKKYCETN